MNALCAHSKNNFPSNRLLVIGSVVVIIISVMTFFESVNINNYAGKYVSHYVSTVVLIILLTSPFVFVYCLITLRWKAAIFVFCSVWLILYAGNFGAYIRDDRTVFYGRAHAVNIDYYKNNRDGLLAVPPEDEGVEGLKSLGDACGLKMSDCRCWLFIDRAGDSGLESEGRAWHHPKAFDRHLGKQAQKTFYKISVQKIEPKAYSVLSCGFDGD